LSLFITLEGPDGSGKTTQARLLMRHLERRGLTVLCLREPGGTPVGEQIREVVLSKNNPSIRHETEALLFSAARAQIVAELIRPARERGEIVLCDRYADSTFAYQGYGLGLDLDALRTITRFATRGLVPDVTFYIDVPVEAGIARKQRGETNRLDVKEIEYHERVRTGYLEMAHAEPERWIIVDGTRPVDEVQSQMRERLDQELGKRGILS
jgi:dTMP kinase